MKTATIHKATGPTTEAGKVRSAINAVRHGLSGKNLLLPGEDVHEYERRLDGIFDSLAPRNDAEAELVALVADDIHKLNRLARIEKGVTLGRIEELLAFSSSGEEAGITVRALQSLGRALVVWAAEPMPTTRTADFNLRYTTMSAAVALVESSVPGIPADSINACGEALDHVRGRRDDVMVSDTAYTRVLHVVRELMTILLDMGQRQDAEQDQLRTAIAGIALPDEGELKKLARYRAMLELSLQRRLAALEQLRQVTAASVVAEKDIERARAYRVQLRVVG